MRSVRPGNFSASFSSAKGRRLKIATLAPASAKDLLNCVPSWPRPPVTTTTRPSTLKGSLISGNSWCLGGSCHFGGGVDGLAGAAAAGIEEHHVIAHDDHVDPLLLESDDIFDHGRDAGCHHPDSARVAFLD